MSWIKVLIYTFLSLSCSIASFIQEANENRTKSQISLASCVFEIADNYFSKNETITVLLPSFEYYSSYLGNILLSRIFNTFKWSVLTRNGYKASNIPFLRISNYYILMINTKYDIKDNLEYLKEYGWNPHARFIIITNEVFQEPQSLIISIFERLRVNHVLDAMFLISRHENPTIFDLYTWFPYSNGKCSDSIHQIEKINVCQNGILSKGELFTEKIPQNLQKCPIRVRVIICPPYVLEPEGLNTSQVNINFTDGFEIKLLNNIARKFNFTLNYTVSYKPLNWGLIEQNGSATGAMKELIDENVDIAIGSIAAMPTRFKYLDHSIAYVVEHLVWCVPLARKKPDWISIFIIFQPHTWLLLASAYFVTSLMLCVLSYSKYEESSSYKIFSNSFLNTFLVLLAMSAVKPRTAVVRYMFLLWCLFSLHINQLFQTHLINKLVYPSYEKQIKNVVDIFDEGLSFGYYPTIKIFFHDNGNWIQRKLQNDAKLCYDIRKCLEQIALEKNYSLAIPRSHVVYLQNTNRMVEPRYYIFKENYLSYPIQLYTYKGFQFLKRMNNMIISIQQTGLLSKWTKEAKNHAPELKISNNEDDKSYDLSIKNLQGAFFVYFIGITIAAVALVAELIVSNISLKY